jgi:hypothetical protein|tara:strand:+ start:442 stop:621 length:180 start_codon:yes stop_codon:yes gene_type:complete
MSKEVNNMYKNMDKYLSTAPKDAPANAGLVAKRGATEENLSVVNYVKQIRKLRGELNVK